ncbi:MAG TPA: type II toxin-antitoxin system VapC family toxin [Caulobacteraceae bacterium]
MKLLLDTHAFVWATTQPERLSAQALDAITDRTNVVMASAICAYELALKRPRDPELQRMPPDLDEAVTGQDFLWLSVTAHHAITAGRLPRLHGDPFDRILAAQAMIEQAAIVTCDPRLAAFGGVIVW